MSHAILIHAQKGDAVALRSTADGGVTIHVKGGPIMEFTSMQAAMLIDALREAASTKPSRPVFR